MSAISGSGNSTVRTDAPSTATPLGSADLDTPISTNLYSDLVKQIGKPQESLITLGLQFTILMSQPNLDPDTAAVILMDMLDKSGDADAKNSMIGLVATFQRSEKLNSVRIKNFSDSLKKAQEAAEKQKSQQTASDVGLGFQVLGAVLGLIGAILLTAFTLGGGAAAIVGAVIGLTTTLLDASTRIAKAVHEGNSELGTYNDPRDPSKKLALDFSIGGAVKRAMEQAEADNAILMPPFLNEKDKRAYLDKITSDLSMAMNLAVSAVAILMGGFSLAGVGKTVGAVKEAASLSAKVTKQLVQYAANIANAASIASDVGGAASMISRGAYGIQIAEITFEKNELDNQKTRLDTWQSILGNAMQSQQNYVASRVKTVNEIRETMASSIANYGHSQANIINKI